MINNEYNDIFLSTTDTVVGIGAPVSQKNFNAIMKLKKRDSQKPLIIMVGSIEQAQKLEGWNSQAQKLADEFWPGATTLILSKTVAVRMPDVLELCNLIKQIGPIYMTSANISGQKENTLEEAKITFPDVKKYYEFGLGTGVASSIIDVNTKKVLR